ncbi:hypothetical protein KW786_03470 [Candidatus Parcubacteria bacterium]|nr:hypothetical protein [Candidatus Parcubacteria bacterium]
MNKNLIIGLVVVLVVLIGGYFLWQGMSQPANMLDNNQTTTPAANEEQNGGLEGTVDVGANTAKTHEVTLTDSGFSPADLKVKAGDTVTFKNQSSGPMWVASASHPTHTVYSGTSLQQHCPDSDNSDFDQCTASGSGSSWSFTFTKTGSWGYHNHSKAGQFGKITVE